MKKKLQVTLVGRTMSKDTHTTTKAALLEPQTQLILLGYNASIRPPSHTLCRSVFHECLFILQTLTPLFPQRPFRKTLQKYLLSFSASALRGFLTLSSQLNKTLPLPLQPSTIYSYTLVVKFSPSVHFKSLTILKKVPSHPFCISLFGFILCPYWELITPYLRVFST